MPELSPRAAALVQRLGLAPHPEGGYYRERFRSRVVVDTPRGPRAALTTIDFLLGHGQFSAWHRVRSDEAWHWLEGGPLVLWLLPPALDRVERVQLDERLRCHVVPADGWQAAEPLADYAHVGATVGPGFDFADFDFGRDDAPLRDTIQALAPELRRLL